MKRVCTIIRHTCRIKWLGCAVLVLVGIAMAREFYLHLCDRSMGSKLQALGVTVYWEDQFDRFGFFYEKNAETAEADYREVGVAPPRTSWLWRIRRTLGLHIVAPNIIGVRINNARVTDELLDILEACPRLRLVFLSGGGNVSAEDVESLEERSANWDVGFP